MRIKVSTVMVCAFVLMAVSCKEKFEPVILSVDQLTAEPRFADFVSIDGKRFNRLIDNLKTEGIQDSTLNIDAPGVFLISTSPFNEGEYLIHPPVGRIAHTFPIEVLNRQEALEYMIRCGNHQDACDCMNGISSKCTWGMEPPRPCTTRMGLDGLITCNPKDLCSPGMVCTKAYRFMKIPGEGINKSWEAVAVSCTCQTP